MERVLVCSFALTTLSWITVSVTACGEKSEMIYECVVEHNRRRAWHWAPNLKWDETLARRAQAQAAHLQSNQAVQNLFNNSKEDGVNIYYSDWSDPTCYEAVTEWYTEEEKYKTRGLCTKEPKYWSKHIVNDIRHFTQVIWRNSTRVGVGRTKNFVVARYSPRGNDFSRANENVWC